MKATRSKDEVLRFTLRIPVRVGVSEMVDAIGIALTREFDLETPINKAMAVEAALKQFRGRKQILKNTMRQIAKEGDAIWAWTDGWSRDVVDCIRSQATVLVRKKFPELGK